MSEDFRKMGKIESATLYHVTGDADEEGRTTKHVGWFIDPLLAEKAAENQGAWNTPGHIRQVSGKIVSFMGADGPEVYILGERITILYEDPREVRSRALAKLTPSEREVLGIKGVE